MNPVLKKWLEPYIKLSPYVGIGLVIVAIAIALVFYIQRGAHVELKGSIQKVRTLALDENSSAAILDFRITNASDYPFWVRNAEVFMVDPKGQTVEGATISEVDARHLFEYFPVLGQKYNETLLMRTKIKPRETLDRMLAVRFEVPEKVLQARQTLRIRIEEIDGPVSEFAEQKRGQTQFR